MRGDGKVGCALQHARAPAVSHSPLVGAYRATDGAAPFIGRQGSINMLHGCSLIALSTSEAHLLPRFLSQLDAAEPASLSRWQDGPVRKPTNAALTYILTFFLTSE